MEITLIRHGQTELNRQHRIQGSRFDYPLNDQGRTDAYRAAEKFNPDLYDLVYSSPAKRALETAQIFVRGHQPIIQDQRLLEFDYGSWDGEESSKLRQMYPDAYDAWGKISAGYYQYGHGETQEHCRQRAGAFLDELLAQHPHDKIVVFSHSTLIRAASAHLLTDGNFTQVAMLDNLGMVKFSHKAGTWRLMYYNRTLL